MLHHREAADDKAVLHRLSFHIFPQCCNKYGKTNTNINNNQSPELD